MRNPSLTPERSPGWGLLGILFPADRLWSGLLCLLLLCGTPVRAESGSKEQRLKAAFLFNFTKFIQWPDSSFASPDAPFVIGILGSGAFEQDVEHEVRDRKVYGRTLVVRKLGGAAEARNVQLLFVGGEDDREVAAILQSLRGAAVLTVGESAAFSRAGGVITFVIDGDKVRFDINSAAAKRASMRISAQLQKLARRVHR